MSGGLEPRPTKGKTVDHRQGETETLCVWVVLAKDSVWVVLGKQ